MIVLVCFTVSGGISANGSVLVFVADKLRPNNHKHKPSKTIMTGFSAEKNGKSNKYKHLLVAGRVI